MRSDVASFIRGVTVGTLVAALLQIAGYLLVRGDHTAFGWTMFILVPFISGFAAAALVQRVAQLAAACLLSGILSVSVMLWTGWEGIVCCVMSIPLIAGGVAAGAVAGHYFRRRFVDESPCPDRPVAVLILLSPFFIAAADRVERPFRAVEQREVFTTTVTVRASPERTWDLLAEMEKLDGPRPFLLRAGLPVPTRCELESEAIGGRRVCYFDDGQIEQRVTGWQRPSLMELRITGSTLPGRHWLNFIDASYELIPEGDSTRVIRHTTIGTRLYPRWYWRPLERWGVTSEHQFVFSNLQRWTHGP